MKQLITFLTILGISSTNAQTIGLTPFATGFTSPTDISHPVNDTRLFVVQQTGAIRILNPNGTINPNNFLTLTTATISNGSERGLLGLTFHPNYATNGYFYVDYTNTAGNTVIARYSVSANPDLADAASGTVLLTITQPFSNHNGGSLKFGPDGYLYIGMGDGGSGGDPGNRAQNITENLGKILRIDVDSASPYGIPADNPYAGAVAGNDEIWAIGVRNPWKFNFDSLNGDLWIADVGQNLYEEIDHVSAPLPTGLNFGWKCYEGNHVYSTCAGTLVYTSPVAEYPHGSDACSITGGYVYRGSVYSGLVGKYIFADYCSNKIGYINTSGAIVWTTAFTSLNATTFGQDSSGEIYIAGGSVIYKLKDTTPLSNSSFDKDKFELYPNPASGEVFLKTKGLQFPGSITIVDITGKTVQQQTVTSETNAISIATLQTGLYIVSIKDQTGLSISSKLSVR